MLIYIITFLVSYFLIYKSKKTTNKTCQYFLEIIAILVLSLLAGLRHITIGTDVKVYVLPVFDSIKIDGFFGVFTNWPEIEIGYKLLNYFVRLFTNSYAVIMFIIQFIIIFFTYYGIKRIFKNNYHNIFIIMLFLFFNNSLNMVRQSISLALCIYSIKYLEDKKKIKFIFTILIASLFHKSSLIFIATLFLYNTKRENATFLSIIFLFFGMIIVTLFPSLVELLVSIGIISSKYTYYLDNFVNTTLDFQYFNLLLDVFFIIIYYKNEYKEKKCEPVYLLFIIIDFIFLMIGSKYATVTRLGIYFRIPAYLHFSQFINISTKNKKLNQFLTIMIFFIYWYYNYVIGKSGRTVPYRDFNGIIYK